MRQRGRMRVGSGGIGLALLVGCGMLACAAPARPPRVAPPKKAATTKPKPAADRGGVGPARAARGPAQAVGYAEKWAVIIGINDYAEPLAKLDYAVNDAEGVAEVLRSDYGFTNITILKDKQATRKNILRQFGPSGLGNPELVRPDHAVFFFFAGHGLTERLPTGQTRGYLAPSDTRYEGKTPDWESLISFDELLFACERLPSKHLFLVADSCFSGGVFQTRAAPNMSASLQTMLRNTVWQALTAGTKDQPVADGSGEERHSIFTTYLLQALREGSDREDNVLPASDLIDKVRKKVRDHPRSAQTPQGGYLRGGGEGGDFVFVKSGVQLPRALIASLHFENAPELRVAAAKELYRWVERQPIRDRYALAQRVSRAVGQRWLTDIAPVQNSNVNYRIPEFQAEAPYQMALGLARWHTPEAVQWLARGAAHPRGAACLEVLAEQHAAARAAIRTAMEDTNLAIPWKSVQKLRWAMMEDPAALRASVHRAEKTLAEPDPEDRVEAAGWLMHAARRTPDGVRPETLNRALETLAAAAAQTENIPTYVRLRALAQLGNAATQDATAEAARAQLVRLAAAPSREVRQGAQRTLGRSGTPAALATYWEETQFASLKMPETRAARLPARLTQMPVDEQVQLLDPLLDAPGPVRDEAAEALIRSGRPAAVELFAKRLGQRPQGELWDWPALWLARMGDRRALEPLLAGTAEALTRTPRLAVEHVTYVPRFIQAADAMLPAGEKPAAMVCAVELILREVSNANSDFTDGLTTADVLQITEAARRRQMREVIPHLERLALAGPIRTPEEARIATHAARALVALVAGDSALQETLHGRLASSGVPRERGRILAREMIRGGMASGAAIEAMDSVAELIALLPELSAAAMRPEADPVVKIVHTLATLMDGDLATGKQLAAAMPPDNEEFSQVAPLLIGVGELVRGDRNAAVVALAKAYEQAQARLAKDGQSAVAKAEVEMAQGYLLTALQVAGRPEDLAIAGKLLNGIAEPRVRCMALLRAAQHAADAGHVEAAEALLRQADALGFAQKDDSVYLHRQAVVGALHARKGDAAKAAESLWVVWHAEGTARPDSALAALTAPSDSEGIDAIQRAMRSTESIGWLQPLARTTHAELLERQGHYEVALSLYERAAGKSPSPALQAHIARLRERLKQP